MQRLPKKKKTIKHIMETTIIAMSFILSNTFNTCIVAIAPSNAPNVPYRKRSNVKFILNPF